MRVFVVGNRGQLGAELMRATWPEGAVVEGADLPDLDVTRTADVAARLDAFRPTLVVNASAYTAVDKAEGEQALASAVNGAAPGALAELTAARGLPIVHVSTDYVFDGAKRGAYVEDDPVAPIGHYGASKAEGEARVRAANARHLVLRTSWVYAAHGNNFVRTMLRLAKDRDVLKVVADQFGRPTGARDLATTIVELAPRMVIDGAAADDFPFGTYHFACAGRTNWHQLASAVIERAERYTGRRPEVVPIATWEYPTPARRPGNSELDTTKLTATLGLVPRTWQASVREVVDELFERGMV